MTRRLARRLTGRLTRPRPDGERGAVMVEFAAVALLLLLLTGGTYDYGMAWRTGLEVNEGARAGARVGSSQGTKVTADFSLMTSVQATLDSSGVLDDVQRVVIFRSTTVDGRVPGTCLEESSPSGPCTVMNGAQVRALPDTEVGTIAPSTGCILNSLHRGFCPLTRDNIQLSAHYLGVWIEVEHDFLFPIIGSSTDVSRAAVMRLEPPDPQADEEVAGP